MAIRHLKREPRKRHHTPEESKNAVKVLFALTLMFFSLTYLGIIMSGTRVLISEIRAEPKESSEDSPVICRYFTGREVLVETLTDNSRNGCPFVTRD